MTKDPLRYFENLHRFVWVCGAFAAFGCGMLISFNERMAIINQKIAANEATIDLLISLPLPALKQVPVNL